MESGESDTEVTEKENKDPRFTCMKICGTYIACRHSLYLTL